MQLLATSNASYLPPRGGSTRSNLAWFRDLASRGHDVRVVAPSLAKDTPEQQARIRADLEDEGIEVNLIRSDPWLGIDEIASGKITYYIVGDASRLRRALRETAQKFNPDWLLVSSEDFGQVLLRESHKIAPGRVVYLAHTPQMIPFGPASLHKNPDSARLVAESAGLVAIGNHTADYVEKHLGRRPTVIHPPVYGSPPFTRRDTEAEGLITIINPSAVKGIGTFLALAKRFPQYRFGALRGWGTTRSDLETMRGFENITLLPKCRHIETVLMKSKVLLMPSLWHEGFGLVVMEAMLRGIPVISSDQGGLVEAKMGTGYVIPVRPIEQFTKMFDENRVPVPVVPDQDIEPWADALAELMGNPERYREASDAAWKAATEFVPQADGARFEQYLLNLRPSTEANPAGAATGVSEKLKGLSPERRALLLRRIRERTSGRESR